MSRVAKAAAYAARVHDGQTRTGTEAPKMAHLLGVTANVLEDAGRDGAVDEDEAVAALLHDAAEDGGGRERLDDIRQRFGERVAEIVEALSDSLDPEPPPWRERKEAYLRSLDGEERPSVLRVSLADKLDNMRRSSPPTASRATPSGSASTPATTRSGTTAPWPTSSREKAPGPMAEELQSSVARLRDGG